MSPRAESSVAYCSILTSNYLPKALSLASSLQRHEGAELHILLVDIARDAQLPAIDGVTLLSTEALGLEEREFLQLATIYDLVELATAVKPLLLKNLLTTHEAVFYLDPDTYLVAPMLELGDELAASGGGILLTPHFLEPERDGTHLGEAHMLAVGVFNLGFCGVDRRSLPFLDWWWGHLETECLYEPMAGLFVDQKWIDIGSVLFDARSLRHTGYNVGVGNVVERPLVLDSDGRYVNSANDEPLRLFHFHAFSSAHPTRLSMRFEGSQEELPEGSALRVLCAEYADLLAANERRLPEPPAYPYRADTKGRRLTHSLRRTYRAELLAGTTLPVPFLESDATAFEAWRRKAWRSSSKSVVRDLAKSTRWIFPDQYDRVKERFPGVASRLSARYSGGDGMWG